MELCKFQRLLGGAILCAVLFGQAWLLLKLIDGETWRQVLALGEAIPAKSVHP